jgi:ABC-type transport system involved in multi-copper enzyme maturation permease subunit
MRDALAPPGAIAATLLLAKRELHSRLGSVWFWVMSSFTCLMAWLYGAGFLTSFETESVLVTTDPLMALNSMVVIFLGIVFGLRLAASMAWEREHRTLEVLLIAPVGWGTIIAAKFVVELLVLILLVALYAVYLLVAQPLGAGVVGARELMGLALIPAFALPVMALGLLTGAGLGSVRGAVVAFLVLVVALAAIEITHGVLAAQTVDQMSLTGLYVRHALDLADPVLRALSPAAQLALPVQAIALQAPLRVTYAGYAVLQALAVLVLAALLGPIRGALR